MADKTKQGKGAGFLCPVFTSRGKDAGLLLLRLFSGGMLLRHGLQKIENFSTLSTTFSDPIGIGGNLSLILIILAEVGGSIMIMTGLLTRLSALAVMFGMFVAAFFSYPGGFSMESSEMPLLYLGMFTVLLITGAGRYSLDEPIRRKLCRGC